MENVKYKIFKVLSDPCLCCYHFDPLINLYKTEDMISENCCSKFKDYKTGTICKWFSLDGDMEKLFKEIKYGKG